MSVGLFQQILVLVVHFFILILQVLARVVLRHQSSFSLYIQLNLFNPCTPAIPCILLWCTCPRILTLQGEASILEQITQFSMRRSSIVRRSPICYTAPLDPLDPRDKDSRDYEYQSGTCSNSGSFPSTEEKVWIDSLYPWCREEDPREREPGELDHSFINREHKLGGLQICAHCALNH